MYINPHMLRETVNRLRASESDLRDALVRRIFDPSVMRSGKSRKYSEVDRAGANRKPTPWEARWMSRRVGKIEAHLEVVSEKLYQAEAGVNRVAA